MRYTIWTKQGSKIKECDSLQNVGDYMFTLPADMLCKVYAQDCSPCFYPYHTFKYGTLGLVGTQHETLNAVFKALT